jgi:hypothetical protein
MLEVSRGTAYGLGFSQMAVTLGVVLFFPPVDVDVYLVQASVNTTLGGLGLNLGKEVFIGTKVFMALPTLACSLLAVCFSTITYQTYELGLAGQDYIPDVIEGAGMWNLVFWMYCLFAHALVTFIVADPADVFGATSATMFMTYFLYRVCYPKPGGTSLNLTQENLNILGYALGVAQMAYQVTDTRQNGGYVVMTVLVLDYFLGLGHTYDRQATLDTIANCRMFYVCAGTLSAAFLYAVSGPEGMQGVGTVLMR